MRISTPYENAHISCDYKNPVSLMMYKMPLLKVKAEVAIRSLVNVAAVLITLDGLLLFILINNFIDIIFYSRMNLFPKRSCGSPGVLAHLIDRRPFPVQFQSLIHWALYFSFFLLFFTNKQQKKCMYNADITP